MCDPVVLVLGKVVEKIVESVFHCTGRNTNYFIHYKENIDKLEAGRKGLEKQTAHVQEKIEEAKRRGDIIIEDASDWQDKAHKEIECLKEFMETKAHEESGHCCFRCSFRRYKLSKQAVVKLETANALTENGKNYDQIVSRPAPAPSDLQFTTCQNYEDTFGSRTPIFEAIMEALKDPNIRKIGIHGTGGVGKTTMVEEIGKQVLKGGLFDQVSMIVVSHGTKVSQIQDRLLGRLHVDVQSATTEEVKQEKLWTRLNNGEKNLVILDDVWDELNLKEIGIPITDGTKGCKLVPNSRSQDICQRMLVDEDFQIQVLTENEAWKLFKKNIGDLDDELYPVAKDVCKECKGLPVAILAIAGALRNKTKHHWDYVLQQLRSSALRSIPLVDEKVYRLLKLSYDHLVPEDAKTCFLICSLFSEDSDIPIEDLVRVGRWMGMFRNSACVFEEVRNGVHTLVDILKATSLLVEGRDKMFVKMHDVVRDVAISIAKDEKGFLVKHDIQKNWKEDEGLLFQQYSTISLRYAIIHVLPNEFSCPELQTLVLESSDVPDEFYQGMKKLNVLVARNMYFSPLPSSFPDLVNLKILCLEHCYLKGIAIIKELKNLEALSFQGSYIEELPLELRQLTRLCLLDLSSCRKLVTIPPNIISNLSRLEELYFPQEFMGWGTNEEGSGDNASVTELNSLSQLRALAISIPNASSLPNFQILKNLKIFNIWICDEPQFWGWTNAELELKCKILTKAFLCIGIALKDEVDIWLEKAEKVYLSEVLKVNDDPCLFGNGRFSNLTCLRVDKCHRFRCAFPSSSVARRLRHLKELRVTSCEMMEEIVQNKREEDNEEVIIFQGLREKSLWYLPNMRTFYSTKKKPTALGTSSTPTDILFNQKVSFPALEELWIDGLTKIKGICEEHILLFDKGNFSNLTCLHVANCDSLRCIFLSPWVARQLVHLKVLSVTGCEMMEEIVQNEREEDNEEVIIFHGLREISLWDLPSMRTFYSTKKKPTALGTSSTAMDILFNQKVSFPALEKLSIFGLTKIKGIWEEEILPLEKSFCQLKKLYVYNFESLANAVIPFNVLPRLQNLSDLCIYNCRRIEGIISVSEKVKEKIDIEFSTLEALSLGRLPNLKKIYNSPSEGQFLFNHQVTFPILKRVEINCLDNIEEIWNDSLPTNSFNKLSILEIERCGKLSSVAPSQLLPSLQRLYKVVIKDCGSLKVIFRSEGWKEGERETQTIQSDELATTKEEEFILPPLMCHLSLTDLPCLQRFYSGNAHIEFPHSINFEQHGCPNIDKSQIIVKHQGKKWRRFQLSSFNAV